MAAIWPEVSAPICLADMALKSFCDRSSICLVVSAVIWASDIPLMIDMRNFLQRGFCMVTTG